MIKEVKQNIESQLENDDIKLWIKDNIMYAEYKTINVTKDKAISMIRTRLSLCKGKAYPFFADVTGVKSIDRDSREEFSHGEGIELMPACALLTKSPVNQILGNFFMFVNKPLIPTKLFTSPQDALEWISKFK